MIRARVVVANGHEFEPGDLVPHVLSLLESAGGVGGRQVGTEDNGGVLLVEAPAVEFLEGLLEVCEVAALCELLGHEALDFLRDDLLRRPDKSKLCCGLVGAPHVLGRQSQDRGAVNQILERLEEGHPHDRRQVARCRPVSKYLRWPRRFVRRLAAQFPDDAQAPKDVSEDAGIGEGLGQRSCDGAHLGNVGRAKEPLDDDLGELVERGLEVGRRVPIEPLQLVDGLRFGGVI